MHTFFGGAVCDNAIVAPVLFCQHPGKMLVGKNVGVSPRENTAGVDDYEQKENLLIAAE